MYDLDLVKEVISNILWAIEQINIRTQSISKY